VNVPNHRRKGNLRLGYRRGLSFDFETPAVAQLLREATREYPVDTCRLYVSGQSMGGEGAQAIEYLNPNLCAAALPLCQASVTNGLR